MATNHSKAFEDIVSRQALAEKLNCDVKALDLTPWRTSEMLT
jgi:hypothetical protein